MSAAPHFVPSLFVLSLPRSLSTWAYEQARSALRLTSPTWTSAGEILNFDRWMVLHCDTSDIRYTVHRDIVQFEHLSSLLDDLVQPTGRAYKDVVQPFVLSNWLTGPVGSALRVLRIRRPLADVAWSMVRAGWHYPAAAASDEPDEAGRLLSGLLRARHAIEQPSGESVDFDTMIQDPHALPAALERLYPEATIRPSRVNDADFQNHTRRVLERRNTSLWRELDARARALGAAC